MDNKKLRDALEKMRANKGSRGSPLDPFDAIDAGLDKPKELDKFQIATVRLIDTLHGHSCGNHLVTTIDNTRATCELMNGIVTHLKKKGLFSSSVSLIYSRKNDPGEEISIEDELTNEMYQKSRKRSNFSKHADKDAHKTLSYNAKFDLDHLLFNMIIDYEALHSALIENNLLDTSSERLYPIKINRLNDFYKYQKIYCPQYGDVSECGSFSGNSVMDIYLEVSHTLAIASDDEVCMVPAGAAACALFRNDEYRLVNTHIPAEKMRELGVWPVDVETHASMAQAIASHPQPNLNK